MGHKETKLNATGNTVKVSNEFNGLFCNLDCLAQDLRIFVVMALLLLPDPLVQNVQPPPP